LGLFVIGFPACDAIKKIDGILDSHVPPEYEVIGNFTKKFLACKGETTYFDVLGIKFDTNKTEGGNF
jgi:hypothetical protein